MKILSIQDVFFSYKELPILKNVSIDFNKGEKIAIVGQNGAGKTTLSKLMNGLLKPTKGNIELSGENIENKEIYELSRHIGYSFQNPDDQIFHDTVLKEIEFGPKNLNFSKKERKFAVEMAAELCGLSQELKTHPYDLPYSQRKFVTLASVIAMNPDILILDEPTGGQDLLGITKLRKILKKLKDTTIIVITHDMEFVFENFNRIIVMNEGKVLADGTPQEIYYDEEVLETAHINEPYLVSINKYLELKEPVNTIEDLLNHFNTKKTN